MTTITEDVLAYFKDMYDFFTKEETPQARDRRINNMPDEEFNEYRLWCKENGVDYYKCRQPYKYL